MTTDAIAAARLDPHVPENPARAEFMAILSAHEEMVIAAVRAYVTGVDVATSLEAVRMSRRLVVASYDRACLAKQPTTEKANEAAA